MKRVTPIWTTAVLTGVLLVAGLAARGAQDNQTGPPSQPEIGQQNEVRRGTVTDEQRADILMAEKLYSKAIDSYSVLIKTYSDSPQKKDEVSGLWNKVGICYQQELDYRKARKAYKEAIKLNREFAPAWNNLGTSFYLERKPKKSIKYYRHAIKLTPDSASFHMNLGTAYFERKKFELAFNEYRTALELDPEILMRSSRQGTSVETRFADARFYFYMAKIYASLGNPNEAVNYLRRAMEEGFNKRKEILDDPDILKISKDPGFIALMKDPPVAIK